MPRQVKDAFGRPYPLEHALAAVGPGWAQLVTALYEACEVSGAVIAQIKEKYGGLRFYMYDAPLWLEDAAWDAVAVSQTICESCGEPGELKELEGWWRTVCPVCERRHDASP